MVSKMEIALFDGDDEVVRISMSGAFAERLFKGLNSLNLKNAFDAMEKVGRAIEIAKMMPDERNTVTGITRGKRKYVKKDKKYWNK